MGKIYYNALLTISLTAFCGAVIYRLYKLNWLGIACALFLVAITLILLKKAKISNAGRQKINFSLKNNSASRSLIFLAIYFSLVIINFIMLYRSTSFDSLISPWQIVPWQFFLVYTLSTVVLFFYALNAKSQGLRIILIFFHFWQSFSVASLVYGVGFGYDSFTHQATEELIAAAGAVYPKPFYYLGQYALIVILHKILFVPIILLDKILVPFLAACFLPPAIINFIKSFDSDQKVSLLTTLTALILPFSFFTVTTPQNLAYIFLLLTILTRASSSDKDDVLSWALALASLAIHPIAGLPALFFVLIAHVIGHWREKKYFIISLAFLASASSLALPTAFYLNNKINSVINKTDIFNSAPGWQLPDFFFSGPENFLLNFVYLYGFNIALAAALLIFLGIIIYRKKIITTRQPAAINAAALTAASLFISYFIAKFISFSYLINYEQSAFSDRILIVAVYFLSPFIFFTLWFFIKACVKQESLAKYSLLLFIALLITASLYLSYPHFDNYHNSRSYSTSAADLKAVRWINNDAVGDNYIVLANQQVSAAALREFGFKKYFKTDEGEIFYYPVPTGARLYQYYLDMVYKKADKATALSAADLIGADTVYFVLNQYWWMSDKISAEAEMEADAVQSIDNGKVYIFKYKK